MNGCADPYARGGGRHGFWWANMSHIRPGLHWRRRRVLAVPVTPWFCVTWWRFEVYSSAHWAWGSRWLNAYGPPPHGVAVRFGPLRIVVWYRDREASPPAAATDDPQGSSPGSGVDGV